MTFQRRFVRGPWALLLLAFVVTCGAGCGGTGGERWDQSREKYVCDPTDPACVADAAPPRPKWSDQPARKPPVFLPADGGGTFIDDGGTFSTGEGGASFQYGVVACNPNLLGNMPLDPVSAGADLQNVSTNFHLLQSLQLLASAITKAAAAADKFSTAAADDSAPGTCVCSPGPTSCLPQATLSKSGIDKATCIAFCNGTNATDGGADAGADAGSVGNAVCSGGFLGWAPNDAFKSAAGGAKFGLRIIKLLDDMPGYLTDGGLAHDLETVSASLANLNDILSLIQCYVDLYTEGYHLGSYSDQRPDLHMCIPWAGSGAYASIADSANGNWGIGARYTCSNLSQKTRAQMRTGGFAVTAFGQTFSPAPGVEFNLQIDGYKWFNRDAPLGIKALGVSSDAGIPVSTVNKVDIFDLASSSQVSSLDTNGNGIIDPSEFIVASYMPFNYMPDGGTPDGGPATWPRPGAIGIDPWEGQEASVFGAALNLEAKLATIQKNLGSYEIFPGATLTPWLKLDAGAKWWDEAYNLRKRLETAINQNTFNTKLKDSDFDRDMHPFQAPDVTSEGGNSIYVKPAIGADLNLGFQLSKWARIGVQASVGVSLDVEPTGQGGIVDLSGPLEKALVTSNPQGNLPCTPVWGYSDQAYCTNSRVPGSTKTYACTIADTHNSCCLTFSDGGHMCLDDWTGIDQAHCTPSAITSATIGSYVSPKILNQALAKLKLSFTTNWSANKSCAQCEADGTCSGALKTPELPEISSCEKNGYCCQPTVNLMAGAANDKRVVDGTGTAARFENMLFPAYIKSQNAIYFGDANTLRRYDLATSAVTTIAGSPGQLGKTDGIGASARFVSPMQIVEDGQGDLYVADFGSIRKVVLATDQVTTVYPAPPGHLSDGLAYVGGSLYWTDTAQCTLNVLDLTTGVSTVFAGTLGACSDVDGTGTSATFNDPREIANDGAGHLFIAEEDGNRIRRYDLSSRAVTTVAGSGAAGDVDGIGTAAVLSQPRGATWDPVKGVVWFTNQGAEPPKIKTFDPSTGQVTTVLSQGSALSGAGSSVLMSAPLGPAIDSTGTPWFTDGNIEILRDINQGCDQSTPGAITYDVSESECNGQWTPYACVVQQTPTAQGWQGPGCHPLDAGFPSACGCQSDLDCVNGETCDPTTHACRGADGAPLTCTCDPTVTSTCNAGRGCDAGACARTCTYNPATASTVCGADYTCSTAGFCVPKGGEEYAEQIIWGVQHPTQPMHAIASYAMTDLQLIAALQAGINIGLDLHIFRKTRTFTLFKWNQAWDIGSVEKAFFQPGLEATYQWDTSPLGSLTNYEPDKVTRYTGADPTSTFLDWCKPAMAASVDNPFTQVTHDIGTSIDNAVNFGISVAQQVSATENVCIGGQHMLDWLQNQSNVTGAFGSSAQCTWIGPVTGSRGPTSFPCDDSDKDLLRIWGCLDVDLSPNSQQMAFAYPAAVVSQNNPATLDLSKILIDPTAPLDSTNIASSAPYIQPWLDDVEACFNDNYTTTVSCTCASTADCTGGAGQTCVDGVCQQPDGTAAQCSPIQSGGLKVTKCCGDGTLEAGEQCDDGNTVSGDGCSGTCQSESAVACCTATGCTDSTARGAAATCTAAGGYPAVGYTCAQINNCGYQVLGSCTLSDGSCLGPGTEAQCSGAGGTFAAGGSCRACGAQPAGISAWYPLDEKSGTVAVDLTHGQNGSYVGAVTHDVGEVNGSVLLTSSTEYVNVVDNQNIDFGTGDFTLSAWVKTTASTAVIAEKRAFQANGNPVGFLFMFYNGGFLVQLSDTTTWTNYVTGANGGAHDGAYHLVTLTVQRGSATGGNVYVDGKVVWTFNPTSRQGSINTTAPLTIGHGLDQPTLDGDIDEFIAARRAMTPAEIAAIFQAGSNGVCLTQ